MRNRVCIALVLIGLGLLASCGGGSSGSSVLNVAGNWQITVTSTVFGFSGTGTGQLNQNGTSLSAMFATSGTPCATTATFTGTLNGTSLSGTLDENGQNTSLKGTFASDGNSVTGTYISPEGGCTNGDAGTFVDQRISMLNGTFIGSLGPDNFVPANIVAKLKDDGGNVNGSATLTNSLCFHTLNITGTVSGHTVALQGIDGKDAHELIEFHGMFDQHHNSLVLTYSVSGDACSGESGKAQLQSIK